MADSPNHTLIETVHSYVRRVSPFVRVARAGLRVVLTGVLHQCNVVNQCVIERMGEERMSEGEEGGEHEAAGLGEEKEEEEEKGRADPHQPAKAGTSGDATRMDTDETIHVPGWNFDDLEEVKDEPVVLAEARAEDDFDDDDGDINIPTIDYDDADKIEIVADGRKTIFKVGLYKAEIDFLNEVKANIPPNQPTKRCIRCVEVAVDSDPNNGTYDCHLYTDRWVGCILLPEIESTDGRKKRRKLISYATLGETGRRIAEVQKSSILNKLLPIMVYTVEMGRPPSDSSWDMLWEMSRDAFVDPVALDFVRKVVVMLRNVGGLHSKHVHEDIVTDHLHGRLNVTRTEALRSRGMLLKFVCKVGRTEFDTTENRTIKAALKLLLREEGAACLHDNKLRRTVSGLLVDYFEDVSDRRVHGRMYARIPPTPDNARYIGIIRLAECILARKAPVNEALSSKEEGNYQSHLGRFWHMPTLFERFVRVMASHSIHTAWERDPSSFVLPSNFHQKPEEYQYAEIETCGSDNKCLFRQPDMLWIDTQDIDKKCLFIGDAKFKFNGRPREQAAWFDQARDVNQLERYLDDKDVKHGMLIYAGTKQPWGRDLPPELCFTKRRTKISFYSMELQDDLTRVNERKAVKDHVRERCKSLGEQIIRLAKAERLRLAMPRGGEALGSGGGAGASLPEGEIFSTPPPTTTAALDGGPLLLSAGGSKRKRT